MSGTIFIAPGRLADADYYQFSGTLAWTDVRPPNTDIGVKTNGVDVAWGPFDLSHIYTISFVGTGAQITMWPAADFLDITGCYGDNSGGLGVRISAVPLRVGTDVAGWSGCDWSSAEAVSKYLSSCPKTADAISR